MRIAVFAAALLFLSPFPLFSADPPALRATVTSTGVEVINATPKGEVVLMTASVDSDGGLLRQVTGAKRFTDDDGDGIVRYAASRPIPLRSIWVAVDLDSGRYAIAGPEGYPLAVLPFPSALLQHDAEGAIGVFGNEMVSAELFVIRPKAGAWRLRAAEGGGGDADKEKNGKLDLAAGDAVPVGGSGPAPKHLRKGDIVVVIDPTQMEVFAGEIER